MLSDFRLGIVNLKILKHLKSLNEEFMSEDEEKEIEPIY